jgi:hypothetical protein
MTAPPLPPMLDWPPGCDAVGRVYALYDYEREAEVLGTVVACWPDRGPTWAVRLHDLEPDERPITVFLYERPESKLGRWFVTRELPMGRADTYAVLIAARKAYDSEGTLRLANPARVASGRYDVEEISPWTRWAGDSDADLMVVGQDWSDEAYFLARRGLDAPKNPTSAALAELLAGVGRPLPPIPTAAAPPPPGANGAGRAFLMNALLWLKTGEMSTKVRDEWFAGDSATFLLEQISIVRPRVVVAPGQRAHHPILRALDLLVPAGPFRAVVEMAEGTPLPGVPRAARLSGVYHCGARVRNTIRPMAQQREDWKRVAVALAGG